MPIRCPVRCFDQGGHSVGLPVEFLIGAVQVINVTQIAHIRWIIKRYTRSPGDCRLQMFMGTAQIGQFEEIRGVDQFEFIFDV